MKKLILILCATLLCVSVSSAGITDKLKSVIAAKNAGGSDPIAYNWSADEVRTSQWTLTLSIDPVDGSANKMLVIGVAWLEDGATGSISALTYDGNDITAGYIDDQPYADAGTIEYGVALYYMAAPVDAAKDVVVTFDVQVDKGGLLAVVLENVKQQAPEADNEATAWSDAPLVSVTTQTNNAWVIDVCAYDEDWQTFSVDTGIEREEGNNSPLEVRMSTIEKATPGAQAREWSLGSSRPWGIIAAAFEVAD